MKVRTIGISLLTLAFAGLAWAQDQPAPTPKPKPEPEKPEPAPAPAPKSSRVIFETSLGNFVLELDPEKAPITSKNFLAYVDDKFFDGTIFHRVMGDFVIQGGGFELKDGLGTQKKTKAPIKNEAKNGLKNLRGSISMARTPNPDSATSQFFISVVDNPALDPNPLSSDPSRRAGYAVFGKVVEGMDVIDKIRRVPTAVGKLNARGASGNLQVRPFPNVPTEPVVVNSARRATKPAESKPVE